MDDIADFMADEAVFWGDPPADPNTFALVEDATGSWHIRHWNKKPSDKTAIAAARKIMKNAGQPFERKVTLRWSRLSP